VGFSIAQRQVIADENDISTKEARKDRLLSLFLAPLPHNGLNLESRKMGHVY
jgi:hypothetical protein